MKKCTVLVATLLAAAIMPASSNSSEAADESPYLSPDHETVRVLRGLEPGKKFEPAKLPVEIDVAPAAAPEPQVEPKLATSQSDGDTFDKAQGRWESQWEKTHGGTQTATTTFDYYGNMASTPGPIVKFNSADDSGKWEGYWVEDSGSHRCDTKEGGSHHWGVVEFQFNEAYNEFEGTWDFCGNGLKHGWKGKRRL